MVIRMRHNRSQTKQRRSHHGLKAPALSTCANCGSLHRPHHMCQDCGFYKGRQVIDVVGEKAKRDERIKRKQEAMRAQVEAIAPNEATEVAAADAPESETKEEKK